VAASQNAPNEKTKRMKSTLTVTKKSVIPSATTATILNIKASQISSRQPLAAANIPNTNNSNSNNNQKANSNETSTNKPSTNKECGGAAATAAAATAPPPIHEVLVKKVFEAGGVYGCLKDKGRKGDNDNPRLKSKTLFCKKECGASVQIKYENNEFKGPIVKPHEASCQNKKRI
jgi:hypothetical protein